MKTGALFLIFKLGLSAGRIIKAQNVCAMNK